MKYKNLSLIQKAMVLIYKNGYKLPFLEKYHTNKSLLQQKIDIQKIYHEAQVNLIGNDEQRRRYWIKKMGVYK